jgi:hypothetical protein
VAGNLGKQTTRTRRPQMSKRVWFFVTQLEWDESRADIENGSCSDHSLQLTSYLVYLDEAVM